MSGWVTGWACILENGVGGPHWEPGELGSAPGLQAWSRAWEGGAVGSVGSLEDPR